MLSRRTLLDTARCGFGGLALAVLAHEEVDRARRAAGAEPPSSGGARAPHFAPRARRVVFLCMEGAPSHVDTFDPKPRLVVDDGRVVPDAPGRAAAAGAEVADLRNTRTSAPLQRLQLDAIGVFGRGLAGSLGGDPLVDGITGSYELALRMQRELPGVLDLADESPATLAAYGIDRSSAGAGGPPAMGPRGTVVADFGRQCLLARRLLEAGVRFVEVTAGGWDHHRDLKNALTASCRGVDGPIAALLGDLDQRGLLDDTLVLWGG